jgi:peptide/nickel transport system substrate-binding protein
MKEKSMIVLSVLLCILLMFQNVPVVQKVFAQDQPKIVWRVPLLSSAPFSPNWNPYAGLPSKIADLVLELLTHHFRSNGTYIPCLAERWELSQDYTWLKVTLKNGVKFHDGTTLTADDLITSMYIPYLFKDRLWYFIESIEKVDDLTVRFNFKQPTDYPVFYILWHWQIVSHRQFGNFSDAIREKINQGYDIFDPEDEAEFAPIRNGLYSFRPETLVGCGPFKVKSVSNDLIVLEKFEEYFGGVPPVDEIHFIRYSTINDAYDAVLNGDIDYIWAVSPPQDIVERIKARPFAWTIEIPRDVGIALYLNSRVYPLSLVEVRRAIAYGINRTEVALSQYAGVHFPSKYVIGWNTLNITNYLNQSFIEQYLTEFKYEYNPSKAEELLRSLGFLKDDEGIYVTPNGTRLELELSYGGLHISPEACNNIAEQLRRIGIKVNVRYYEDYYTRAFCQGEYQIGVGVSGDPKFSFDEIYHKYLAVYPGHGLNRTQHVPWKEDPVDVVQLAERIGLYPVQLSKEELTEIYSELSYITGDQLPVINLYQPGVLIYMNKDKFEFPMDPNYWSGLGSYEGHGLRPLFALGWLKLRYSMSILSEPATIAQGGSASYLISISNPTSPVKSLGIPVDSERQVCLNVVGLPEGTAATFTPERGVPPFSSTLFITTSSQTPPGTYSLYVTAAIDQFLVCKKEIKLTVAPVTIESYMSDSDFNPVSGFDVVFTPDKATKTYKLVATNPGSYFYNLIVKNVGSTLLNPKIVIEMPGEFVLKGVMPIHVFSDMARLSDVTSSSIISIQGQTISVTTSIPPQSLAYVTIHLDFSLKGTVGYTESDCTNYARGFKIIASVEDSEKGFSVKNMCVSTGVGQKVTAIGGFVLDVNALPKSGLKVQVYDGDMFLGESPITPSDGFYFLKIPPGGPYTVKLFNPTTGNVIKSSSISVEKYEYRQVDFLNLNPADPVIEGYVFNSDMKGIGDVVIELYNKQGKLLATTRSEAGGKYVFRFTSPGTYFVKAIIPSNYICDTPLAKIEVKQFETIRVDFILKEK